MTLKPPWHSINVAAVLWSLGGGCGLVQGAAARAGMPGSPGHLGDAYSGSCSLLHRASAPPGVPQLQLERQRLPGFCGAASSPELSPCRNAAPLSHTSHASGQKELDVVLPTLLVEAGSGGSCGQRWPSPWPGLDRGWGGQRNARLWQNSLYKFRRAVSQSTVCVSCNKESTCHAERSVSQVKV